MQFRLTIELGNDAMHRGSHVADALYKAAGQVNADYPKAIRYPDSGRKIMDVNGNSVGQWEVIDPAAQPARTTLAGTPRLMSDATMGEEVRHRQ